MENNTSGQGSNAAVPYEVDRWNWGAFLLNWIWGVGNNTFIALLMFVPFVNIVMPFVLGARGSAWAWRNKRWESIEQFRRVQRLWGIWGLVINVATIGLVIAVFWSVMAALKHSDVYLMGVAKLQSNTQAVAVLGAPVSTGIPMGNIEVTGTKGKADIAFSADGTKARGTVYLDATKDLGRWTIERIELQVNGRPERIDLNR